MKSLLFFLASVGIFYLPLSTAGVLPRDGVSYTSTEASNSSSPSIRVSTEIARSPDTSPKARTYSWMGDLSKVQSSNITVQSSNLTATFRSGTATLDQNKVVPTAKAGGVFAHFMVCFPHDCPIALTVSCTGWQRTSLECRSLEDRNEPRL